ncbi:hypothetical protein B7494_g2222 [Chlorociboria aeruginascens]|nr:hypothetical protein B7494_g2222 [Chlorociboria aeruginascens]
MRGCGMMTAPPQLFCHPNTYLLTSFPQYPLFPKLPTQGTISNMSAASPNSSAPSTTLAASSTSSFAFPREYNFPPFFSHQDNSTTYHAQCQKWTSLILSYCRACRIWKLALVDAIETELFWNKTIGKRLSINDARDVVDFMRKDGRAEWIGKGGSDGGERSVAWIWWRTPEEWAGAIADWVRLATSDEDERGADVGLG